VLHTVLFDNTNKALSQDSLLAFAQDGAILLKGLLSPADYASVFQDLAQRLALLEQYYGYNPTHLDLTASGLSERIIRLTQEQPECQKMLDDAMIRAPGMHQFAGQRKLISVIQSLLSSTVEIHPHYSLQMTLPEDPDHLPSWHQDHAYHAGPESTLTLYAPLQKVNFHNGSLLLALGEHHRGILPHETRQNNTQWHTLLRGTVNEFNRVASAEMELGDILVFNSLLPHTARLNQSHSMRFIINLQYRDLSDPSFLSAGWRIQPLHQTQ